MLAFVPMPTAIADVFVIGEDGIGSLEECLRRNESSQIVTHRAAAVVTGEGKAVPVALSTSVGEGDRDDALDHLSQVGSSGVLMQFVAVCQNRPQSSADESIANGDCVVTRENFVTPAANRCNYDRIELEYLSQGSYGSSTASSSSNAMEGASGSHRDPAHMRVWDDTPTRGAQLRASGRQATTTARASSSGLFADL